MRERRQYLGAIFDQDGLLFDTEVVFSRCWMAVGAEMGVTVPDEMTRATCGCGTDVLPEVIRRYLPTVDPAVYIPRVFRRVTDMQLAMTPVLKPGVREILAHCRAQGIRTAIATSSIRRLVDHNLAATGLTDAFDAIVTGGEVKRGKPAPDIFLLAAERLGLAPADCVVFEDAFTGIRAAHAAGCRAVLVPDRLEPTSEILERCTCCSSLNDCGIILGRRDR